MFFKGHTFPSLARSRLAVSVIFFINGLILASWVPHIPMLKRQLAIGDGELGLVLLSMAVGAVGALSIAGRLVRRFGSRVMTIAAALGLCLALPLPIISATTVLVASSLLLLGACNGTLDVSMNAQAVVVERHYCRAIMSSFHGLFSLGGLAGAGCAGLLAWLGISPLQHVLATTGVTLGAVSLAVPFLLRERSTDQPAVGRPRTAERNAHLRRLGLLAFAALLAEGAMADWSAVYLHDVLASGAALAAAGFAACSMMMAVGRFGGDRLVAALGPVMILRASGGLAAAGLGLALVVGTPLAAILGCGMVGLGIANAIPILFSRAGNLSSVEPGIALATVAATGYLGFLTGPPAIGLVAELTTLRFALALVVVCSALIAVYASAVAPESDAARSNETTAAVTTARTEPAIEG